MLVCLGHFVQPSSYTIISDLCFLIHEVTQETFVQYFVTIKAEVSQTSERCCYSWCGGSRQVNALCLSSFFINESVREQKAEDDTHTQAQPQTRTHTHTETHTLIYLYWRAHHSWAAVHILCFGTDWCVNMAVQRVEVTDSAGFIHQLRAKPKIQCCVTATSLRPTNAIMPSTGPWGQTWQLGQWPHIHLQFNTFSDREDVKESGIRCSLLKFLFGAQHRY